MPNEPDIIPDVETALRTIERDENDPDYDLIESHKAIRVVLCELARLSFHVLMRAVVDVQQGEVFSVDEAETLKIWAGLAGLRWSSVEATFARARAGETVIEKTPELGHGPCEQTARRLGIYEGVIRQSVSERRAAPTNYPDNVPFVDSGFSWTNQTTGTGTSTDGDIFILSRTNVVPNDSSLYLETVPSTPYKLWTRFLFRGRQNDAGEAGGICWYNDSSGAWMFFGLRGNNQLLLYGATQVTPTPTFTNYYDSTMPFYGGQSGAFSLGLEDDGTNKDAVFCPTLQYSRIFRRFTHSEYITPTHIGLWIADGVTSGESYLEVLSYDYY